VAPGTTLDDFAFLAIIVRKERSIGFLVIYPSIVHKLEPP
jgi:hypothetical protein